MISSFFNGVISGYLRNTALRFMAVAHVTSPFVTIYDDTNTKLSNPTNLPTDSGRGIAFSSNGQFMAVAHSTSPFVTIYEISGTTFTKLSDPTNLPTGTGVGVAFNNN